MIDRGNLRKTEDVFVVKGETSRSHEIDEKGLHEELGSSDRSGKSDKLSENIRVKRAHDGTGQPVEQSSSSAHTVRELFAPEENRDIASFNTDNEFNRAYQRGEHRLQHSRITTFCSETITWRQRSKFDSEGSRTTLSDMHFKVIFNNIDNSILSAKNHET